MKQIKGVTFAPQYH